MTKISCLIVDDEPLALDLLERYVQKTPFLHCQQCCSSAIEALEIVDKQPVDLIFLDIQMPELSGLEFSRIIGKEAKLIFTTAFNDYAVEGFKVNTLDYLLKPIDYEEFLRAAYKAKEWFDLLRTFKEIRPLAEKEFIFIKSAYKQIKINLNQVLYFEGLKDYVKIWLEGQAKPILTILSLKSLTQELPASKFMRIHRSFIISLDKIQSVERNQVIITENIRITIAEQYKKKFQDFINYRSINS